MTRIGAVFKTPRTIRMARDYEDLKALKKESTILDFEAKGDPPDDYIIRFSGNTLVPTGGEKFPSEKVDLSKVAIGGPQEVSIQLGGEYPRNQPRIEWLTPIVHPNIWGHGTVCLGNFGGRWTPYYKLIDLVEILWDMARLAILNPRSAGTGGSNAVPAWDKADREIHFPVDRRPLRDKVLKNDEGSSILRPNGDENDVADLPDDGGNCPT